MTSLINRKVSGKRHKMVMQGVAPQTRETTQFEADMTHQNKFVDCFATATPGQWNAKTYNEIPQLRPTTYCGIVKTYSKTPCQFWLSASGMSRHTCQRQPHKEVRQTTTSTERKYLLSDNHKPAFSFKLPHLFHLIVCYILFYLMDNWPLTPSQLWRSYQGDLKLKQ